VTGSGAVAAARTVALPFQQSGTITAVNVKIGDQVKAGQVLAKIDDADLQLQLQQAQANLDRLKVGPQPSDLAIAQAQVASAQAALDLAHLTLDEATLKATLGTWLDDQSIRGILTRRDKMQVVIDKLRKK